MATPALIELKNVQKSWLANTAAPVLAGIHLTIHTGEFVAILGPSGSGKSTLLRMIAGLTPASGGEITYEGQVFHGVNPGAAMVFQSFALFPWLTVLENVLMGLEASALPRPLKKEKALQTIDLIGLDGFENAYPKELSGGMQQRVGLGRALVSEPDVLLMDEPFSALDVLTAENLRRDILKLWRAKKIPIKTIIMVTHGIEEAVYMADRILVVAGSPAHIHTDLTVPLPHWRNKNAPAFIRIVDQLYSLMMRRSAAQLRQAPLPASQEIAAIPRVLAGALTGFLELLADLNEKIDLYKLGDRFMMDSEDFFPIVDGAALLQFAKVTDGDIELTAAGRRFANASALERKDMFRASVLQNVAAIRKITAILQTKLNRRMNIEFFAEILAAAYPPEEVQRHLDILIDWGRYAEIFAYDEHSRQLFLE